jgi:hypothetical protein
MKKHFVFGIVLLALVSILVSFSWNQQSDAADKVVAFYGTAKAGRTVMACKQPGQFPCFSATAGYNNWYILHIPSDQPGWYFVCDGCQSFVRFWDGSNGQRLDFCVPDPPHVNCNCW